MFGLRKKIPCARCGKKVSDREGVRMDDQWLCPACAQAVRAERDAADRAAAPTQTAPGGDGDVNLVPLSNVYMALQPQANIDAEYGAALVPILREYKQLWRQNADPQARRDCFIRLAEQLFRTLLAVPFRYDADRGYSGDRALHLSQAAAQRLNRDSIVYRCQQLSLDQMDQLRWVVRDGVPTIDTGWWDLSRFPGSEGYAFAEPVKGAVMFPRTGSDANGTYLLCFTGVDQLLRVYGTGFDGRIGLFTAQELIGMAMDSPQITGLIVNPDTDSHCFIDKGLFKRG